MLSWATVRRPVFAGWRSIGNLGRSACLTTLGAFWPDGVSECRASEGSRTKSFCSTHGAATCRRNLQNQHWSYNARETDEYRRARLLSQGGGLPMGVSGPYPRPGVHPADRWGALLRSLHDQLAVERFPGHPRARLRPSPGEPACRRGRIDNEPVAICRLKRVAADLKDDVAEQMPKVPKKNGKRVACIGAGPASLTVAAVTWPWKAMTVTIFDSGKAPGGMVRTQIPKVSPAGQRHRRGMPVHPRSRRQSASQSLGQEPQVAGRR